MVGPIATGTLFGAEREPKDRPRVSQVLSWRPRFFDQAIGFLGDLKAIASVLQNRVVCRMYAKGFNEHGHGLDVGRCVPRSEEFDRKRVEEFTSMNASSMSDDALLGAKKMISSMLKGSRAWMQTRRKTIRS
jgi:hypothetical protein